MNPFIRFLNTLHRLFAAASSVFFPSTSNHRTVNRSDPRREIVHPTNTVGDQPDSFRFAPELFEARTEVIEELARRGFDWLSHYSSVDPIHDSYGIEICGIHDRNDAISILQILTELFPCWRPG